MRWFITGLVLLALYFLVFRRGNPAFWRLSAKYPDEVYKLMNESKGVWLIDPIQKVTPEWEGPFRLYIPILQRTVKIYGKSEVIKNEQQRITLLLKVNNYI